jgi:hypothetical protein
MSKSGGYNSIYPTTPGFQNPYQIDNGVGGTEDISWMLY